MLNGCNRSKTDMFVFQWNAFNWLDLTSMSQPWGNQATSGDGEHQLHIHRKQFQYLMESNG